MAPSNHRFHGRASPPSPLESLLTGPEGLVGGPPTEGLPESVGGVTTAGGGVLGLPPSIGSVGLCSATGCAFKLGKDVERGCDVLVWIFCLGRAWQ